MTKVIHPVQKAADDWQQQAIAMCMEEPAYEAKVRSGRWCASCDMSRPCLCDRDMAVRKMRKYYEANRRTLLRSEPTRTGSWGVKVDVLMEELYKIATSPTVSNGER